MPDLKDLEVGLMFWAGPDPVETLRAVKAQGFRCGQLGVPGDLNLKGAAGKWKAALAQEDFKIVTVFASYRGESYADIPTVLATVGFIPPATRAEREARTLEVIDFAADIGAPSFACHVGFVPEDTADENYTAVRDMVRRICDHAELRGLTFALETGQEPAKVLMNFLQDVDRSNIGINFDPANMILYGTGDPIEALDALGKKVLSVHCKDGDWPPREDPNALGTERALGQGAVGMERYIRKLKEIGFRGTLNIEREIEDQEQKKRDVAGGKALLEDLAG
jgi:sugar phosphate isomerase/epimerase